MKDAVVTLSLSSTKGRAIRPEQQIKTGIPPHATRRHPHHYDKTPTWVATSSSVPHTAKHHRPEPRRCDAPLIQMRREQSNSTRYEPWRTTPCDWRKPAAASTRSDRSHAKPTPRSASAVQSLQSGKQRTVTTLAIVATGQYPLAAERRRHPPRSTVNRKRIPYPLQSTEVAALAASSYL